MLDLDEGRNQVVRGGGEIGEPVSESEREEHVDPRAHGDAWIAPLDASDGLAGGERTRGEFGERETPAPAGGVEVGAELGECLVHCRRWCW